MKRRYLFMAVDEKQWKKLNKPPACTSNPIEHLIPNKDKYEILRQIREECIDHYGQDIISECNKRKVCLTKKCLGRELPWKSPTALPYLQQLTKTQEIQNGEMFVKTDCSSCPLVKACSNPCSQVLDYIQRDRSMEPQMVAKEHSDKLYAAPIENVDTNTFTTNIPWDALTDRRRKVIKMHLYERRDFKYIANKLNLNNQARAKYEYYAALTTVSEYAIMREFLEGKINKLTEKQQKVLSSVYYDNNNLCEVAANLGISKQAIQQMISRVVNKYEITWPRFVWKKGNRVIYNVPQILK